MKTRIQQIGKIFYGLVVTCLLIIAGVVALSVLNIPGNIKLLVVQSGSMEPAIRKGAVVVVKPQANYEKGDVITSVKTSNRSISLTHRIYSVEKTNGKTFYVTKGDANNAPDGEKRASDSVIGKTIFSVPFLGYLVSFAKTENGFIFLVVIPAIIIVYGELLSMKNEIIRLILERKSKPKKDVSKKFEEIVTT